MKRVSVVVPCYNAAKYLEKCMGQLLCQTIGVAHMEIILVDDASTDGGETWNLITEFEAQYPDIIIAVSLTENMRQGGARNVGVSYASGEYVMFCDADDWLLKETLEHSYDAAKEYDADVVEFLGKNVAERSVDVVLERGNESRLIKLENEAERKDFLLRVDEKISYGSQTKLYKLSMIRDNHIRFVEHRIFEEPSFVLPIRLYEKRHFFLDERLYIWYLSPDSTVRSDWGEHKWDNPKVWLHIIHDMAERGILQEYYEELEYMFFGWGLSSSIRMAIQKGYTLTKEEYSYLVNMMLRLFPDVRENKYVKKDAARNVWKKMMVTLMDVEFSDESTSVVNDILRKYI